MKRWLALAVALAVTAVACGDSASTTTGGSVPPATEATPTTVPATTEPPQTTSSTTTTAPTTTMAPTTTALDKVVIVAGYVSGDVQVESDRVEVSLDSTVEIQVTGDLAEEVHVHGYDYFADIEPGQLATITFVADIPGIFEVELEDSRLLLFELEVS